jgi:WD40 repeat protein
VAFALDGTSLLSAGMDGTIKLWQVPGLAEQRTFVGHEAAVLTAAFFHDAPALVSGGEDNTVIVWDRNTGKAKLTLRGHRLAVAGVTVSPDDKQVASASRDGTVRLWNVETGAELAALNHDGVAVHAVAFSHDGKQLGTSAEDGKIRLWDVKTRKLVGLVGEHKAAARAVAFSPDGALLASGSTDKTVKLWPLRAGNKPATLETESELVRPILALAYSPDGNVIAMATTSPEVQIRDAASGDVLRVLKGHAAAVNCLAFSKDGQVLASGSADHTLRLWDMATAQEIGTFPQDGEVHALAFTRDGTHLACAGSDGVLRVWGISSGKESKRFPAHDAAVHALGVAPDGRRLVTGCADGTISICDLSGAGDPTTLKAHAGAVRALAFSVRGVLASAGDDHLVKLWEPTLDREQAVLTGHEDAVTALAFTPSGRTLVSGSRENALRVWDGATGELLKTLRGHQNAVTTLAIHPRGKDLVSGSLDTMALRWRGTTKAAASSMVMANNPPGRDAIPAPPVAAAPAVADVEQKHRSWLPLVLAGPLAATLLVSLIYMLRRPASSRPAPGTMSLAGSPPAKSDPSGGSCAMSKSANNGVRGLARPYAWLIAIGLVVVVTITALALGLAWGGGAEGESEFYHDFRGRPLPPDLTLFNVQNEKMLQVEPEGVRIKIPKDWIHPWGGVGFLTAFGLKGDFDVTVTLEILRADRPGPGAGWGSGVCLQVRRETGGGASVSRVGFEDSSQVILCDHINLEGRGKWFTSPCTEKVGRLRFKRTGGTLSCQWAPGTEGNNFEDRQVLDFGTDNIQDIRLAALNGRTNAEVDVRLLNLRVRSRIARGTSLHLPGGKLIAALLFGLILAVGLFVAARPRRARRDQAAETTGESQSRAEATRGLPGPPVEQQDEEIQDAAQEQPKARFLTRRKIMAGVLLVILLIACGIGVLWTMDRGPHMKELFSIQAYDIFATRIMVTPDGSGFVAAGTKGLCLGRFESPSPLKQVGGGRNWALALSADGQRALMGGNDRVAHLFDLRTGKQLKALVGHQDAIWAAGLLPDGKRAVTGAKDQSLRLWNLETGKQIALFPDVNNRVRCLAVSPDGNIVAAYHHIGPVGTIRLWDVETQQEIRELRGHSREVTALGFSADGKRLVTSGFDDTVRVWDVPSGTEWKRFDTPGEWESAAFAEDDRRVLCAGNANAPTVQLWDIELGRCVVHSPAVAEGFHGVAALPGKRAVTAGRDGVIRLWEWKE